MPSPSSDLPDPIDTALAEDLGSGDLTALYFIPEKKRSSGRIFVKQPAILAGVDVAAEVFRRLDPTLEVAVVQTDGAKLREGTTVLTVCGTTRSIVSAERVALNFIQQLSGIATLTGQFVEGVGRNKAQILDTRKTTPGLRALEKAAVKAGGGRNHRFGLFDMVMVKDNHLVASKDLEALQDAIDRLHAEHPDVRVELEADTLNQVRLFTRLRGVDVILLDNMSNSQLREAVALRKSEVKFEASGGVTLLTISAIAATGVDYISVGAITHSAPAVDFSLELNDVAS